jgi:hypothetical protein
MPPVVPHAPIPHGRRASNTSPPPPHDKHFTLGFLGGGMMASALIKGLLKAEVRAELLHCTVQRATLSRGLHIHMWVLIRGSMCVVDFGPGSPGLLRQCQ